MRAVSDEVREHESMQNHEKNESYLNGAKSVVFVVLFLLHTALSTEVFQCMQKSKRSSRHVRRSHQSVTLISSFPRCQAGHLHCVDARPNRESDGESEIHGHLSFGE